MTAIRLSSALVLLGFLGFSFAQTEPADDSFRAGAFVQDITPPFDSLLINGSFTERKRGPMNPGDLKARCFVLQRGETTIAIAIVDSCMIPRTVCDRAKALTTEITGIPPERILIAATHTHSAPSTMDYCLGTMADVRYTKFLPSKLAEGFKQAQAALEPARIGWKQVRAPGFTHCRRWITRPDTMRTDPFGNQNVRAMMHPGHQNPAYVGPSGPVDDELSILSIQTATGRPLAVLANFSMHYRGGSGPADYFGLFADRLAQKLGNGDESPVCAMSQGTSGDLMWMDYSQPKVSENASSYTDGLVQIAAEALEEIEYEEKPPLGMDERTLTLSRRLPDAERIAWADEILDRMKGGRPGNLPEVYAEQARFIHENPSEKLVLQALRIGDLAITALPNEVYSITGLKLKARSPFPTTFNIELANGAAGYIPPREQHALGGYTTWPARTAGLEIEAEPKIVDELLDSLESLSGMPRREASIHNGIYAQAILEEKPLAFWRCEEMEGGELADASGNNRRGRIEGLVAYHLPGPDHLSFSSETKNRALHLAGGTVSASLPEARSVSFWFWNGMDGSIRGNTGDLVGQGDAMRLRIGGSSDGESRGRLILESGNLDWPGSTGLALRGWHHVLLSRDEGTVRVFLDGNPQSEIEAELPGETSSLWRIGGDLSIEGKIDEVAWFQSVLGGEDAEKLYAVSGMTAPPKPPASRPRLDRGPIDDYAKAVRESSPIASWRLRESSEDSGPRAHHGTLEEGARTVLPEQSGDTFTGGRLRAAVEGVGDTYSVEFWFRNSLPNQARPVTGYLFSRGVDGLKSADGDSLGIGGTYAAPGRLIVYQGNSTQQLLVGKSVVEPESWHHVAMVREGERIRVYLNGNPEPEIDGALARSYPEGHPQFFFGGRNDNFANLQGRLDEVALYDRALTPEEIKAHYGAVKLTPVAKVETNEELEGLTPEKALEAIHVPEGYEVQLVAAEPLVEDPVAIDWGADGKLWVAEMADYPSGIDGMPGGRVRFLEDSDGDGIYDKSTLFLEGLNFPSGVMSWRNGVVVTAAPDIFFAEDTDGDGKADKRTILFTGFKQGNQQLRVNGLRWGLDNWIHGANGSHHARYAAGIEITSPVSDQVVKLGSLDFRIQPELGLIEPLSGPSQFGRARDDWGNWFGVQNSFPIWHYVLEHRYLARNPDFAAPDPRQLLTAGNPLVFPAKAPQKRFHNFNQSGRFTSACAPMIHRDDLLFRDGSTYTFTCEPFHNLVQRRKLERDGVSFTAERAESDGELDFFASEDRWCRPVMARTGPDGALWVVDMYRYMIEHSDWLPKAGKAEMKPYERLGTEFGRIYRVLPKGGESRPVPRLDRVPPVELVKQLASRNGIVRDMAHRLLIERGDDSVTGELARIAANHEYAQARLHALCVLDGLNVLDPALLEVVCRDSHPQIRRHALRLAESRWEAEPTLLAEAIRLADDPDAVVRLQAACSLGASKNPVAGKALAGLMIRDADDPFIRAAVLSSSRHHFDQLAEAALNNDLLVDEILKLGGGQKSAALISRLAKPGKEGYRPGQFRSLAGWLDLHPEVSPTLSSAIDRARKTLSDESASVPLRTAAIELMGRQIEKRASDQSLLSGILTIPAAGELKLAAIEAIARMGGAEVPDVLLGEWSGYLPRERFRVLDLLLQRVEWAGACLDAIEAGVVARGDLDASRRQLLLRHSDETIREEARRVLESGKRNETIKAFQTALDLEGNEKRGRVVFQKLCASCHLPGEGLPMNGPDLRSITDRTPEGLFSSILDPNQSVDPSYAGYTISLKDESSVFGRVLSESSSHLTLRLLDGTDRQLRRSVIGAIKNSGLSLMPEGLEAAMTKQDLADLIRFVQGFRNDEE